MMTWEGWYDCWYDVRVLVILLLAIHYLWYTGRLVSHSVFAYDGIIFKFSVNPGSVNVCELVCSVSDIPESCDGVVGLACSVPFHWQHFYNNS